MKPTTVITLLILSAVALLALANGAHAADPRYIEGPVIRDANGEVKRSAASIYAFRKYHPCPVTGRVSGACPGWAVDHVIPLACGGVDAPVNMQWLPTAIKSCAGDQCKDRWERKIYCPKGEQ